MKSGRRYDRASPTRAESRHDGIDPEAAEQWYDDCADVGEAQKRDRRLDAILHQQTDAIIALNAKIAKSGRKPPDARLQLGVGQVNHRTVLALGGDRRAPCRVSMVGEGKDGFDPVQLSANEPTRELFAAREVRVLLIRLSPRDAAKV